MQSGELARLNEIRRIAQNRVIESKRDLKETSPKKHRSLSLKTPPTIMVIAGGEGGSVERMSDAGGSVDLKSIDGAESRFGMDALRV